MNLNVFVHGKVVATLSQTDGFVHHLTYRHDAAPEDFVSLLMPVQPASLPWPELHPFFRVSLPEGFLLSLLKEQLGPHLGASPLDLLAVTGQNTIGRVQVAAGDVLLRKDIPLELQPLLHGETSADVFLALMRDYASSGVSGVVPKFLSPAARKLFRKGTLPTDRYLVKGSSAHMPFLALNEHLCMEVARRTGFAAPATQVSDDGQVLVVERFDIDPQTGRRLGFEDCCSLLGLNPEDKYQSTWERVARLARQWVPDRLRQQSQEHLAVTLLLTFALGNADCHTKNVALLYSGLDDVRVAPVYDMLTIRAYDRYARNPPGMYIDGRKSWTPGKTLWRFLQQHLGIDPARQRELVGIVCEAVTEVFPALLQHIRDRPGFAPVGAAMIREWDEGMQRFSDRVTVAVPDLTGIALREGIARALPAAPIASERLGESPLLASRKKRTPAPS
ncbi:hypothetical protein IMCC9480_3813 [Oxalobacteraceae bacterium IMCC9480]|nr:hypothetical protein IMCC9480_3813 [Oxalobacteraceae bacterium IMCC9480]NDP60203.1 type II toxin-antitoxin system HipA family toxin [Oxalobacteraceae bacterium]